MTTEKIDTLEVDKRISRLLSLSNSIEGMMEWCISDYIYPKIYTRQRFLIDNILTKLTFERKRQLLKEICDIENVKDRNEMINCIEQIMQTRNKAAHGERFFDAIAKKIKIQKRGTVSHPKDDVELTDELMDDIEKKTNLVMKCLGELSVEFRKPNIFPPLATDF